jgi:hypothetical protein
MEEEIKTLNLEPEVTEKTFNLIVSYNGIIPGYVYVQEEKDSGSLSEGQKMYKIVIPFKK